MHLMANLRRMRADSWASAWTRAASADTPASRGACERSNAATLAGSAVSRTLPSVKTMRMSASVWYVFWETPQHMPEELLLTMPPIMHESIDEGSGPILYWTGCPPATLWRARIAFTSPPIRPGSTVMREPSPWTVWRRKAVPVWESLSRTESVMAFVEGREKKGVRKGGCFFSGGGVFFFSGRARRPRRVRRARRKGARARPPHHQTALK